MDDEEFPETIKLEDVPAKAYTCVDCGWQSQLADWNDDDSMEEARQDALDHARACM